MIKKFPHKMRCAVYQKSCDSFARVLQCITCKILCHTSSGCHSPPSHFMPPCSDQSHSSMEEAKRRHTLLLNSGKYARCRIFRHQWVPYFNLSIKWCSHCGYLLSLKQGNQEGADRRCEGCNNTCHAQCQALIPNGCGLDPGAGTLGIAMINPIRIIPQPTESERCISCQKHHEPGIIDGTAMKDAPEDVMTLLYSLHNTQTTRTFNLVVIVFSP